MYRRWLACLPALLTLACAPPFPPARAPRDAASEIAEVYARFSAAANARSWEPMLELFAKDASWEATAGPLGFRHEGRPTIARFLRGNEGHVQVLFYLAAPPHIEVTSPELAQGETSINEILRLGPSGEIKQLFGVYKDRLRKEGGRWVFVARRFELRREQPLPS